jgi:hypothetical protein
MRRVRCGARYLVHVLEPLRKACRRLVGRDACHGKRSISKLLGWPFCGHTLVTHRRSTHERTIVDSRDEEEPGADDQRSVFLELPFHPTKEGSLGEVGGRWVKQRQCKRAGTRRYPPGLIHHRTMT